MQLRLRLPALIAISLTGATAPAIAMGNAPGNHPYVRAPQKAASAGAVSSPASGSTTTTGMGSGASSRRSEPNMPTPAHPAAPAKSGQ